MISTKKLHWKKNGTKYYVHLINQKITTSGSHQLAVRVNGETLYTDKLVAGKLSNRLCVRKDGQNYYVKEIAPAVTIKSTVKYNQDPYGDKITLKSLDMYIDVAINNPIYLQYRNAGGSWVTFLTLPAGAVSVNPPIRPGGDTVWDLYWRFKVGSWDTAFWQNDGTDTTTRSVPSSQWGV